MGVPLTCWGPIVPSVGARRERAAAVIVASCHVVQAGHIRVRLRPSCAIGGGEGLHGACPEMGRHQKTDVSQGNTMEQYTTAMAAQQRITWVAGSDDGQSGLLPVKEPSQAEILAAIQGSRVVLEGKIEMVAVEVNLLQADL
ncbi:hypothetical protein NDU88_002328 [Pleurodeles waltl]|uniref:Uncharacterized protein n=1 Tax=Pleurodeles waltl TaxID=8319 RepID=A0AAV7W229_PLEWA|nr:hypothetical protein NDU88_002328 [Pleurodeles waltl]